MSNTLYNKDGVAIPPRPEYSEELIATAVKKALEGGRIFRSFMAKNPSAEAIDKFAQDFAEIWYDGADAYEAAKEMESNGHKVNAQFVDDIEMLDSAIFSTYNQAEREWAAEHQPVAPFEVGTRLRIESNYTGKVEFGAIEEILKNTPAAYCVLIDGTPDGDTTRRLIKFEDAVSHATA